MNLDEKVIDQIVETVVNSPTRIPKTRKRSMFLKPERMPAPGFSGT
jgi:hypothetical protein